MRNRASVPVALAIAGVVAIAVGIHQDLLHVAPGYQATINAGAESLNRRDWLLAGLGVLGAVGAVGARQWRRLSTVPVAVGGIVVLDAIRSMIVAARGLPYPIYTEATNRLSGEPIMIIYGAEPFLFIVGGVLLAGAGIARRRFTD